jgi:ABC-type branched-subunit amino acid transport system substrate-binding protein
MVKINRSVTRVIVALACVALAGAACGRSSSSEGADDAGTSSSSAASTDSSSFGDLTGVCQSGSPSGSPTTGVTADEIRIATFSDVGFAGRPGLNQEFFDAADVFAEWCNAKGGINGRKIVVDKRDAALTNVQARMNESCTEDFAMVGGGATFDQDGVDARLKCLLPDVAGFVASVKARGADLLVQPEPNALTSLQVGNLRYLGKKYPDATQHIGVLTGDLPLTKEVADQNADAVNSFGWKIDYNDVYPAAGVTTWTPYAQQLKDSGTKGLIWVGEPEGLAGLLRSLRDIGYSLDFVRADANHYDQKLTEAAGDALADTPVYVQVAVAPFEDAAPESATGQYLAAFEQYKPDGKSNTYLGVNAWSAWLLFAKAAGSCGNDLTRTCMYDAAKKIDEWTGGGLHAAADPASGESSSCFGVIKATPTGFTLMTDIEPNEGIYNCNPKNLFELTANVGESTTLADVGQDIKNMK